LECLDSSTVEASAFIKFRRDKLAAAVRKHHLPDFSNWQRPAAFARALAPPAFHFGATSRLENALRASISKQPT
jgi:hypothetical protein